MASILSAGTTSGTALNMSGDTSGVLQLASNNGTTAVTIDASQNATFAKSIILSGSTSGTTTLASTAVAGTTTATFPAATGTVMVSGNMPAFSAYRSGGNQSVSNGTATKVQLNTEEFDTANCFDSTTNYRFTPTVAGYYQINGGIGFNATTMSICITFIYKNGSSYKRGDIRATQSGDSVMVVSSLVYFNGSTDYVELYGYLNATAGSPIFVGASDLTYFNGTLVRNA